MFTDHVKVHLVAGNGGNGIVAWRREKRVPKGGPTGGNGGKGGSVIIEVDSQLNSLDWYRHRHQLKAETGRQGGPYEQTGRNGKDLVIKVPCGTLVKDAETGELLRDLTKDKERWEICKGGKGGRGNSTFCTPTNQAPNNCTPGTPGEEIRIEFELKLIAEIGLVGFPNAGKSTLISALANVKVKIAAYPFTTLQPNLGYIQRENYTRIMIADIPGIIEDAHQNRGLGLEFLRHIERTNLLLFVIDASGIDGRDPSDDYRVLREEIAHYNPELLERPYLVVLNKIDADEAKDNIEKFHKEHKLKSGQLFEISALTKEGIEPLRKKLIA